MTFNWGHKLILVFVAFAAMMITLAYKSMHTNYELVSKEYYKDELAYQKIIDGSNKANALSAQAVIKQEDGNVLIQLPSEMKAVTVKGDILFYCAADSRKDRKIEMNMNSDAVQVISSKKIEPGTYTAKISWNSNGQFYYAEETVTIH